MDNEDCDKSQKPIVFPNWKQKIYLKVNNGFCKFCGYDLLWLSSVDNFIKFLHTPRDATSIGIARMLFGLMMMIDIPDERSGSELDYRWGDEKDCRFPLFSFLEPMTLPRMGIIYGIMWLGALGLSIGYKFKYSCLMFTIPYSYIFLIDKSAWNNHSYLYLLMGLLFTFSSANVSCSLDSHFRKSERESTVPFWNYFLFKFQFYILYTYAGMKKFTREWLSGYSMTFLSNHWVFTPFRLFLGTSMTDLLIVHWFGCIFDLTIAFWLTYKNTRVLATIVAASFHLMNSRLFSIGMFPWVCLVELHLFYSVDWPRKFIRLFKGSSDKRVEVENYTKPTSEMLLKPTTRRQKLTAFYLFLYCIIQLFLPYSHFITKGYNNWTNGLYGYSWDMMVHAWDTIMMSVKVVDNNNGKTLYLDPYAFSDSDRWTKHADMAKQYSECIHRNLKRGIEQMSETPTISSENVSIYFDILCSLNGRFQQRMFNPQTDILTAKWSPLRETEWVLPLLTELNHLRPKMIDITNEVLQWNNYSDVLFIADFPGLYLENFITDDLDNVTLTIIDGQVKLEYEDSPETTTLQKGQSIPVKKSIFHKLHVISERPASYMYTFVNATLLSGATRNNQSIKSEPMLPIWDEIRERWKKFELFLGHVANSLLYEFYGVPMPKRIRH